MVHIASSTLAVLATTLLSALSTHAEQIPICTDASCAGDCPLNLEAYLSPDCLILETGELDNKGYELNPAGGYIAYFDIPQPASGCQYIIGSGAGCGAVVGRYSNAICTRQAWTTTLSFSYCCGDCGGAGDKVQGTPVEPKLIKRDCSSFSKEDQYEITGPSHSVSNPVTGPADVQISTTVESSRTTSFSSSIGDPWGIISATVGVEFEESVSTTLSYTFQVLEGQTGYIAWSPTMTCVRGTLSGCDGLSDENGQACTPKKDSNGEVVGQYNFVSSSRKEAGQRKRAVPFTH
ncbi:hypothetical protein BJX66DRAFT_334170 [Aspergillus keveii]|uniref:Uncharacterized protein n=1 Tax=Aspergillus keveii TaxID=714993 RepID=A0ABR4GHE0_9EURO